MCCWTKWSGNTSYVFEQVECSSIIQFNPPKLLINRVKKGITERISATKYIVRREVQEGGVFMEEEVSFVMVTYQR